MSVIIDTKSAKSLVKHEMKKFAFKYADYIGANNVTLETVAKHVAELTKMAYPEPLKSMSEETKYVRKGFNTRVRNGLNTNLGKGKKASKPSTALLTGLGLDTFQNMSDVEILAAVMTELESRAK